MKLYSVVIILCFLFFGNKPDFRVINAGYQNWTAGIGTSKGTKYFFTCIANKSSRQITIDKIWIKDRMLVPDFYAIRNNKKQKDFFKGDTIIVFCSFVSNIEYKGEKVINKSSDNTPLPYKYDGEALISYTKKGKRKYMEVKEMKKIKSIPYPQKPPAR